MNRLLSVSALCVPVLILGACDATHVAYVHNATLGLEVSGGNEGTTKFVLGFDRETFAIVPRYTDDEKNGEAMTVTAISRVDATGIDRVQFGHVVATGNPAKELAQNPEALRDLARRIFGEPGGGGR